MMTEINKPNLASTTEATAEVAKSADIEVTAVKVESATVTTESPKQS